jgi:signal transduction histidine kinase
MWWGYLLFSKNTDAFIEKVELDKINFMASGSIMKYEETSSYLALLTKYQKQRRMILGEGLTFLILQIIGLLQVRRVFAKEIQLAAQQRNFLHSITHELKSPLSGVKLSLQTLIKRTLDPEQKSKLINNALSDVERLESLVDNILFAAKIERDTHGFSNEEINISDLLHHISDKFNNNKKEIKITTSIKDGVYYHTDMVGFTSVVINLIENAIKYSEPQTKIEVSLDDTDASIILKVKDQGYGIPDNEKKNVFQKFYRVGSEDTRKTKGTGLGLFIVGRFVEIYKGKIYLMDNQPHGSVFVLTLPKS